jgi:hypothetical protein
LLLPGAEFRAIGFHFDEMRPPAITDKEVRASIAAGELVHAGAVGEEGEDHSGLRVVAFGGSHHGTSLLSPIFNACTILDPGISWCFVRFRGGSAAR